MNIRAKILTFAVLSALTLPLTGFAQSHSQMFDALGYNTYWNGSAWVSYAAGYGHVVSPSGAGDWTLYTTGNAASAGLTRTLTPVMAVTAAGTVSATAFSGNGSGLTGVTASVSSGASGSLVYRDQSGNLVASSGLSISSTTGSVGIGAGAPQYLGNNGLYVTGEGYFGSGLILTDDQILTWGWTAPVAAISGSYATKSLSFITNQTEAMRIVSTGYVGIGTSTPLGTLDVRGSIFSENGHIDGIYGDQLFFGAAPNGYPSTYLHKIKTSHSLDTNAGGMIFSLSDGTETGYRDVLTLKENGNVGIGTTTPYSGLDVHLTASGQNGLTLSTAVTGYAPFLTWKTADASNPLFGMRYFGGGAGYFSIGPGDTNGFTEALNIKPNGNVGIGTSSPAKKLHVYGDMRVDEGNLVIGNGGVFTDPPLVPGGLSVRNSAIFAYGSGNVGIGTTSPNAPLDVNGTVSATNIKAAGTVTYGAYSSQPVACSAGYKGMVAMSNALGDLCLCTGTAWVRVGSGGTACSW